MITIHKNILKSLYYSPGLGCFYVVLLGIFLITPRMLYADSALIARAVSESKKNVEKWVLIENEWTSPQENKHEQRECLMEALDTKYSVKISRNRSVDTLVFQSNGIAQDSCSCELKVRLSTKDGSFHSAEGKVLVCAVWPS